MRASAGTAVLTLRGTSSFSTHSSHDAGMVMVPTFWMEKWRLIEVK